MEQLRFINCCRFRVFNSFQSSEPFLANSPLSEKASTFYSSLQTSDLPKMKTILNFFLNCFLDDNADSKSAQSVPKVLASAEFPTRSINEIIVNTFICNQLLARKSVPIVLKWNFLFFYLNNDSSFDFSRNFISMINALIAGLSPTGQLIIYKYL